MKSTTVKKAIESGATSFEIPFSVGTLFVHSWEIDKHVKGMVLVNTYVGTKVVSLNSIAYVQNHVKLK